MSFFKSDDRDIEIAHRHFKRTEISLALDTWKNNASWIKAVGKHYENLFRGVGHWMELIGLQSVSSALPPIPYGNELMRSKINIFEKGGPGFGKGQLITLAQDLMPRVERCNVMTSAGVIGSINKHGNWVPGRAYLAKWGILAIPELFQTIKRGENFESLCEDLCEILEYPHRINKTAISYQISDIASTSHLYDGVSFPEPNQFEYEAPCCGLVATAEFSLPVLLQKLNPGFLSRFIDIPIVYSSSEADEAVKNFWDNVLLPSSSEDGFADKDTFRRLFHVVWWFNLGWGHDEFGIPAITSFRLPSKHRDTLEKETLEAMKDAWKKLNKNPEDDEKFSSIPVFFREAQDLLRIVCADAASRRYETDENLKGEIEIDAEAVKTGIEYLYMIAMSRIATAIESAKILKLSSLGESYIGDPSYCIIKEAGEEGIFRVEVVNIMQKPPYNWNERRVYRHIDKLINDHVVSTDGRRLWAKVSLIEEKGGWF